MIHMRVAAIYALRCVYLYEWAMCMQIASVLVFSCGILYAHNVKIIIIHDDSWSVWFFFFQTFNTFIGYKYTIFFFSSTSSPLFTYCKDIFIYSVYVNFGYLTTWRTTPTWCRFASCTLAIRMYDIRRMMRMPQCEWIQTHLSY